MKRLLLLLIIIIGRKRIFQNLQLRGRLSYGNDVLANIGGYVDSTGKEYALVGTYYGLNIVDVSNPSTPVSKFIIPGADSDWREVKTYRKTAYVTTEGGGGLTVVDLSHLPDTVYYHSYLGDGAIAGQIESIHALHVDTAKGFLYLYGSNLFAGSTMFFDLTDQLNPVYAGGYNYPGDAYVHDGMVMNDTMYESHIYSGFFTIVDVTNKANPILLGTQSTPTAFTHNTWLSDDHHTLFTTDENSNSFLTAYDITDPSNIEELSRFQRAPGSGAIVHNTHILNDYAITSWYTEGVVITDVSRPRNPIEVGHFDTDTTVSGNGFEGCWGVYPFLPSGTIVASDINLGLFVLTPTYVRGCYLEGVVTDSLTGAFISGATIQIVSTSITKTSDFIGEFRTGTANPGTYSVIVSRPGYVTKTFSGLQLTNGVLTPLNAQLVSLQTYAYTGTITDSASGQPLTNSQIILEGNGLTYTATSNSNGVVNFAAVVPDNYSISAGKWGYRTQCSSLNLTQGTPVDFALARGYYDDFTFDFGWTVSGTSANAWERGIPIVTYDNNNTEINPGSDVSSDCGGNCFVTDNGGAPYNNHDLDNGDAIITSPYFDATIYVNPVVSYSRRFLDIDGLGQPNDSMIISITNGTDMVSLEEIGPNDPGNGTWLNNTVSIQGLLTLTDSMRIVVRSFDDAPGNIVEAAFDQFEITGQIVNSINKSDEKSSVNLYPNPFNDEITMTYNSDVYNGSSKVIVKDITGRIMQEQLVQSGGKITFGHNLCAGIYMVIIENGKNSTIRKVVKR